MRESINKSNRSFPFKWELVFLLWVAYFLNQGDRQIFNVVIPLIKEDLQINDVQIGWIASIFTLVYGLLVPVAGVLSDKLDKVKILLLSLAVFSIGTLLTGIGQGVIALIIYRSIATGGGEAFYYPAANSLIAKYHDSTRATAMAIHQTSLYAGVILSGFIAGYLGEHYGWRVAFYVFGAFGILWAIVIFLRMRNKPADSVELSVQQEMNDSAVLDTFKRIASTKTAIMLSIAFGFMCFVNIGYLTWIPTYLHEKYSLTLASSGLNSTLYHFLGAFFGVLLGAKIADRFAQYRKTIRLEIQVSGLLIGAPFIFLIGQSDSLLWTYVYMFVFGFFRGVYDSNLFAALFDVIESKYRAAATGFMLSFGFVVGAFAPVLLGHIRMTIDMAYGITLLSICYLIGALMIFLGLKLFFKKENIS
ncbi:MFS transporter [Sphingobacterium sp. DK4209]|uniref:MFS transporter n=1 Tax=Sphingobacterium zhuxiongii TaxID=2662364 RepID=A0A5Q0QAH6_9SPHI|nr:MULTISPECIES: MFS transporter [unclassified Sphingobacterium]MVZ64574.1 MFS transporter [Sphingobacterium sp. DK4209]QGA25901.1 MFS transporter [Sphingobacterium sp. dk4302]